VDGSSAVEGSKSSGRDDNRVDVNRVVLDHRYIPTSPTCDVARNIDVGENARLVTGDDTRKQSTSLRCIQQYSINSSSHSYCKNKQAYIFGPPCSAQHCDLLV